MGNQTSQPCLKDPSCSKFIHFLPSEIKEWSASFKTMFPGGKISSDDFVGLFASLFPFGTVEPFCEKLFQHINISQSKEIDLEELLIAFTILLKGSTFERLRWIFRFYDSDKDGFVGKSELVGGLECVRLLTSNALLPEIDPRILADEIFNQLQNQSGFLTFDDFETLAQKNPRSLKRISLFTDQ